MTFDELIKEIIEHGIAGLEKEALDTLMDSMQDDDELEVLYQEMSAEELKSAMRALAGGWKQANKDNAEWITRQRSWLVRALMILMNAG